MKKIIVLIFCVLNVSVCLAQDTLTIISYNVENLFDNKHDTLKKDEEFTPQGKRHWTYQKWQDKLDKIAQVIINIGQFRAPLAVGLCEVENKRCLEQLCYRLRAYHYHYIHYESEDERGIDVALLYDSTQMKIETSKAIKVDLNKDKTRDILYVKGLLSRSDSIHIFVCHLPSQLGGTAATEWKRQKVKETLQTYIDSIYNKDKNASIICMGDMNNHPQEDLKKMKNLTLDKYKKSEGTHKWKGKWTCLDQFYISDTWPYTTNIEIYQPTWLTEEDKTYLGRKPKRTYLGYKYQNGYSDHLPLILKFCY